MLITYCKMFAFLPKNKETTNLDKLSRFDENDIIVFVEMMNQTHLMDMRNWRKLMKYSNDK